ncbi:hypothetical protein EV702DRAFT_344489 [Suillus placidus]|uniref:Uncharacterized protein n=1 Tax=Suillus placidus TaxID=48579 RepID=A0A9P6ZTN6_9AGAM|nr:hypothetical protein EV702DRAFT_344489 [Suillus placidus]
MNDVSYIMRVVRWARMSRIGVNLDLHIFWISERYVTGYAILFVFVQTQNQHYNHLGKLGSVNFLGVMGLANAQPALDLSPSPFPRLSSLLPHLSIRP